MLCSWAGACDQRRYRASSPREAVLRGLVRRDNRAEFRVKHGFSTVLAWSSFLLANPWAQKFPTKSVSTLRALQVTVKRRLQVKGEFFREARSAPQPPFGRARAAGCACRGTLTRPAACAGESWISENWQTLCRTWACLRPSRTAYCSNTYHLSGTASAFFATASPALLLPALPPHKSRF